MTRIEKIIEQYTKMILTVNLDDGDQKAFATRMKRAISWYLRADQEDRDPDAKVLFFWIAFNSLYGKDSGRRNEKPKQHNYLKKIARLGSKEIHNTIIKNCKKAYTNIMHNEFILQDYWDDVREGENVPGNKKREDKLDFELHQKYQTIKHNYKNQAILLLNQSENSKENTERCLKDLFERIYVIRNQIIHGGSSWNSEVNREQIDDGCLILETLIPVFIELMLYLSNQKGIKAAANSYGGKIHYPPYRCWNDKDYFKLDISS